MIVELITSLLLGSSLAYVLTPKILEIFKLDFFSSTFSQSIPSFTSEIHAAKNFDLTFFFLSFIIFITIFAANHLISRKFAALSVIRWWYFILSLAVFLQTRFVYTSSTILILFLIALQLIYFLHRFFHFEKFSKIDWRLLANSFLLGFSLLLLAHNFTSVFSLLMGLLVTPIFFYQLLPVRLRQIACHPFHLLLFISLFVSTSPFSIIFLILLTILLSAFTKADRVPDFISKLYPAVLIFIFVYNPLYYVGNFDIVEEGFWSAWNQRLLSGQVPYRDFLMYHPPLLLWGLHFFTRLAGFSLANQKLFFHLLQIFGLIIFYYFSTQFISSRTNRLLLMLAAISYSATLVSNNFEIRLAFGLLAIYLWHTKKFFLSGISTTLAFFISPEVGIVATISLVASLFFISSSKISTLIRYLLGVLLASSPILGYLWIKTALISFFQQLYFYSHAFSSGYFNTPVDRQFLSSFLNWHIVNQYLSLDSAFSWELVTLVFFAVIIYSLFRKKSLLFTSSLFALGLFRSALGRSDHYHLLPLLFLCLIFIVSALEAVNSKAKNFSSLLVILLLTILSRNAIHANYVQTYLYRLQTYAKVIGEWGSFNSPRSGLLLANTINPYPINDLLNFLSQNTSPQDKIFIYPWSPHLYFLSDRQNSTIVDTPYAFFTADYQSQVISELTTHPPKYVVYNSYQYFGGMKPESLPLLTDFITASFPDEVVTFGDYRILTHY